MKVRTGHVFIDEYLISTFGRLVLIVSSFTSWGIEEYVLKDGGGS